MGTAAAMRARLPALLLAAAAWMSTAATEAQSPPVENTGPNAAITRLTRGGYVYRTLKDARLRGTESFELVAHPDGTRTLLMWNDLFARNSQYHAVLRVDARFRPIEAEYSYWSEGRYRGGAYYWLDGSHLEGRVRTAQGAIVTQQLTVPEQVSFATHPLAGDGWHSWYVDRQHDDYQEAALINFDASADVGTPALARLQSQKWRFVAAEKLTVPAGTFDCERYTTGTANVWVTGPDRVLVRFEWPTLDREYVLSKYETTGSDSAAR